MTRKTKVSVRSALLGIALLVGLGVFPADAAPADYPNRPIDLIVTFAPGGASDSTARLLAPYLAKKWGQPINVINQAGGSAIPGTNTVMRAKPDGYTILLDAHSVNSMLAAARTDLPFKWDSRTPIARAYLEPVVYTVKVDAPWKTLKEVIAAIKTDPQTFKWGAGGVGAIGTFSISELFNAAGIDFKSTNRVIFNGGGPTLTALAGGHVFLAGQQLSEVLPLISGGLIRGLAVVLPERAAQIPKVPTAKEAGFPTLQVSGWTAFSGPPNLPPDITAMWTSALKETINNPEAEQKAYNLGKVPAYLDPEGFKKYMYDQYKIYLPLAETMGIRK